MAVSRQQAEQEFLKHFTNREFTDQDFQNAQTYGVGIFKASADQIKAQSGTPVDTSGRSLDGTMTGTERTMEDITSTSPATPTPRSIGSQQSAINNFTGALRTAALAGRAATRQTPEAELGRYAEAGVPMTDPTAQVRALNLGRLSRTELEQSRFSGALDLLKQQQKNLDDQKAANLNFASGMLNVIAKNPALLASITGEEMEQLKAGIAPPELIQKIGLAAQSGSTGELETEQVKLDDGTVLLIDSATGETIQTYGTAGPEKKRNTEIVTNKDTGERVLVDEDTGEVVKRLEPLFEADTAANAGKIADLKGEKELIGRLKTHEGMNSSVGPTWMQRIPLADIAGAKDDFLGQLDQLLSIGALNSLIEAKAQGATFGALNETEFNTIKNAANSIAARAKRDSKTGQLKGIDMSQDDFISALNRVEETVQDSIDRLTTEAIDASTPEGAGQYIDSLFGGTDDDIDAWIDTNVPASADPGNPLSLGTITGIDGSPLWKNGLDIDLQKGDSVPTPDSGTVIFAGVNGGFGNQVKIRDTAGNEIWLSHLDSIDVQEGDTVERGQYIGLGGNSGLTIPGPGGDGSHLDLTVKLANGSFLPPREIARVLGAQIA